MNKQNSKQAHTSTPLLKRADDLKRTTTGNHYVNLLQVGDDALLARIHLIRSAKKSILIQTFIWRDDEVGLKVLCELFKAARRGVKVKILIDYWVFNKEKDLFKYINFQNQNFEILIYNPSGKKLKLSELEMLQAAAVDFEKINHRMHNKTFIVDEKIAIIGGRNYDNMYYDRGSEMNFIDLDLMVTGRVVKDIQKSFDHYRNCGLCIRPFDFKDIDQESFDVCEQRLKKAFASFKVNLFSDLDAQLNDEALLNEKFIKSAYQTDRIRFVFDKPELEFQIQERLNSGVLKEINDLFLNANDSVLVQSPYLVLSREAIKEIKRLGRTKPKLKITVSTNSLAATDNLLAYAFLNKEKHLYTKNLKIDIFEMKPRPSDLNRLVNNDLWQKGKTEKKYLCIHAKVFIMDNQISWVGTYNADVRSEYFNTEIALIIDDKQITQAIKERITRLMAPANSWTVAPTKYIPTITEFNDLMTRISHKLPVIDLWPFRNVKCYELKEGRALCETHDPNFHAHYRRVDMLPKVMQKLKEKRIIIRLIQMFGQVIKPLV